MVLESLGSREVGNLNQRRCSRSNASILIGFSRKIPKIPIFKALPKSRLSYTFPQREIWFPHLQTKELLLSDLALAINPSILFVFVGIVVGGYLF